MKPILLALALLGAVSTLQAQTPPPPVLPGQPAQAPIDGGLGLLAAAGGVYALRKLKKR
jgi:hypothetical protein